MLNYFTEILGSQLKLAECLKLFSRCFAYFSFLFFLFFFPSFPSRHPPYSCTRHPIPTMLLSDLVISSAHALPPSSDPPFTPPAAEEQRPGVCTHVMTQLWIIASRLKKYNNFADLLKSVRLDAKILILVLTHGIESKKEQRKHIEIFVKSRPCQ